MKKIYNTNTQKPSNTKNQSIASENNDKSVTISKAEVLNRPNDIDLGKFVREKMMLLV